MKKRVVAVLLSLVFSITLLGGNTKISAETTDGLALTDVGYTTVTQGFDWGPAITKVILNMGTTIDTTTLTTTTFNVSSERKYSALDFTTNTVVNNDIIAERNVVKAYVSDAKGNKTTGNYVTIEMEVGPTITAGSPFNYDMTTSKNVFVETNYIIKLADSSLLKTTEGKVVSMEATDAEGNKGNATLVADEFDTTGTFTSSNGIDLTYASFTPKKASTKKDSNPLIIWLHGAGEGGIDPMVVLLGNEVPNLATTKIQSYFGKTGAYILVPQCKTMWMDDGTGAYTTTGKSYYTKALMSLISSYVKDHPEIDTDRIYIGGCSNGGYMTINMITTYPKYFAAAYPICEAFSNSWLTESKIKKIKNLPIWFTHAANDPVVVISEGILDPATYTYTLKLDSTGKVIPINDFSNAAYARLKAAGSKNVYYSLWDNVVDTTGKYFKTGSTVEPYEYLGHFSWIYALNNQNVKKIGGKKISMFKWLSQQSK